MSRSGYSDDIDNWELIKWRGAVASAIRGRRGQAFLREMLAALHAMPERALVREELQVPVTGMPFALKGGGVCAMGAVARMRGVDLTRVDPEDRDTVAGLMEIPMSLACEIAYENDERGVIDGGRWREETAEERFKRMRRWALKRLDDDLREYGPDLRYPEYW